MEHGHVDNVANTERLRTDLYELTCKMARMAQAMEDMQDKWHAKEKAHTYEKANDNLDKYAGNEDAEKYCRRGDGHRGEAAVLRLH